MVTRNFDLRLVCRYCTPSNTQAGSDLYGRLAVNLYRRTPGSLLKRALVFTQYYCWRNETFRDPREEIR